MKIAAGFGEIAGEFAWIRADDGREFGSDHVVPRAEVRSAHEAEAGDGYAERGSGH